MLTRWSVDCAERIVAASSSYAFLKCSSVSAPGCCSSSASKMAAASRCDFMKGDGLWAIGDRRLMGAGRSHGPQISNQRLAIGISPMSLVDRSALVPPHVVVRLRVHAHVLLERADEIRDELDGNHDFRANRGPDDVLGCGVADFLV